MTLHKHNQVMDGTAEPELDSEVIVVPPWRRPGGSPLDPLLLSSSHPRRSRPVGPVYFTLTPLNFDRDYESRSDILRKKNQYFTKTPLHWSLIRLDIPFPWFGRRSLFPAANGGREFSSDAQPLLQPAGMSPVAHWRLPLPLVPPPAPSSSSRQTSSIPESTLGFGARPAGGLALLAISSCGALFLFPELPSATCWC